MQCNIDRRGRALRIGYGVMLLVVAAVAACLWAVPVGGWVAWTVTIAVAGYGAFVLFEGLAGWCVVRAMGFKTPI